MTNFTFWVTRGHNQKMKILTSLITILTISPLIIFSQEYIKGSYHPKDYSFHVENSTQVIRPFRDGLCPFEKNDKFGVIDTSGKIICQPKYDEIEGYLKGVARVTITKDWVHSYGYIDHSGKEVIPVEFDQTDDWYYRSLRFCDFIIVGKEGKYGAIDVKGNEKLAFIYESIGHYQEGLASIRMDGKGGFIDTLANVIIPCEYEWIGKFLHGRANVKKDGLWGHIDKKGNITTPIRYEAASEFHKGFAPVKLNSLYGRVNMDGELIIPCKYRMKKKLFSLID